MELRKKRVLGISDCAEYVTEFFVKIQLWINKLSDFSHINNLDILLPVLLQIRLFLIEIIFIETFSKTLKSMVREEIKRPNRHNYLRIKVL